MTPKRLVLLVEGQGDVEAVPILVKRLLGARSGFDAVLLDGHPFRVGEYSKISRNGFGEWRRFLEAAGKRKNFGGCMLLLDGDSKAKVDAQPFCAMRAAQRLAAEARKVGGGSQFSVAIVFACMEFESWLIAGIESLAGKSCSSGLVAIHEPIPGVPVDPETSPRDAKGWLRKIVKTGYKPARDQAEMTRLIDLDVIRRHGMRSFRRLESAIQGLVDAFRCGQPAVTPAGSSNPEQP